MPTGEIDYTRHYRHFHDCSDRHFAVMATSWAERLAQMLPPDRNSRLEIGCGTGFAIGGLAKAGFNNVEGIDADRGQVEEGQRRGLPIQHVQVGDTLAYLASMPESFDVALAFDVLEHVPIAAQIDFLKGIFSILKPGGLFLCQVPNCNSGVAMRYRYIDWTHHCSFSERSLDFVLFNSGFEEIRIVEATPNVFPKQLRLKPLAGWGFRSFFRLFHRLELASECGWSAAKQFPLSPNIVASCRRSR